MFRVSPRAFFIGGSCLISSICSCVTMAFTNFDEARDKVETGFMIFSFVLQYILVWSVSEIPLKFILSCFVKPALLSRSNIQELPAHVLNYNIKASSYEEITECYKNATVSMSNNNEANTYVVVISATTQEHLKNYESSMQCNMNNSYPGKVFLLRRTCNVLKKCGQYQDLIMLCAGHDYGYTYCNDMYGSAKRPPGTSMFEVSDQTAIIKELNIKYTMVLDIDTIVPSGALRNMILLAENHPEYGIVQPAIRLIGDQTVFQIYYKTVHAFNKNLTASCSTFCDHSSFFGKGLLNHDVYTSSCLGDPSHAIDGVPIGALSHDTFESLLSKTLYDHETTIEEPAPCTYLSWHSREERWNTGDLIVLYHLLPGFHKQRLTDFRLDFERLYIALAPVRVLFMRPVLFLYIIVSSFHNGTNMSYVVTLSVFLMVFFLQLFAGIQNTDIHKLKTVLSAICSVFFIIPEPITGTFRFLRSVLKSLQSSPKWIPSALVDNWNATAGIIKIVSNELWMSTLTSLALLAYGPSAALMTLQCVVCLLLPFVCVMSSMKYNSFLVRDDIVFSC